MPSHSDIIRKFERFMFGGVMQSHQGNTPCYSEYLHHNRNTPRRQPIDLDDCTIIGYIMLDEKTGKESFIRTHHPAASRPKPHIVHPKHHYYFDEKVGAMRMKLV